MRKIIGIFLAVTLLGGCGSAARGGHGDTDTCTGTAAHENVGAETSAAPRFDADSAYAYVKRQVEFGPRVPNTEAHARTAAWLAAELRRHGAQVVEQKADLKAFDGTVLKMTNIMGSYNPQATDRLLLLAHYDTRPWADQDPDAANHSKPIDGANDGASGVAVLLETARMLGAAVTDTGIDILFVDAEDYGTDGDDDSWAMGARYFAENPIKPGYRPSRAILLDMVGDADASFPAEYMSRQAAPDLDDAFRAAAQRAGFADRFPRVMGGAVTDDHVQLIRQGVPAIDIIDYRPGTGFCPTWHTLDDNLSNISRETLRAVGQSLFEFLNIR